MVYSRRKGGWVATKLEELLDRAVEITGLGDDWHHPMCGRRWAAQSNQCRRYCRNQTTN